MSKRKSTGFTERHLAALLSAIITACSGEYGAHTCALTYLRSAYQALREEKKIPQRGGLGGFDVFHYLGPLKKARLIEITKSKKMPTLVKLTERGKDLLIELLNSNYVEKGDRTQVAKSLGVECEKTTPFSPVSVTEQPAGDVDNDRIPIEYPEPAEEIDETIDPTDDVGPVSADEEGEQSGEIDFDSLLSQLGSAASEAVDMAESSDEPGSVSEDLRRRVVREIGSRERVLRLYLALEGENRSIVSMESNPTRIEQVYQSLGCPNMGILEKTLRIGWNKSRQKAVFGRVVFRLESGFLVWTVDPFSLVSSKELRKMGIKPPGRSVHKKSRKKGKVAVLADQVKTTVDQVESADKNIGATNEADNAALVDTKVRMNLAQIRILQLYGILGGDERSLVSIGDDDELKKEVLSELGYKAWNVFTQTLRGNWKAERQVKLFGQVVLRLEGRRISEGGKKATFLIWDANPFDLVSDEELEAMGLERSTEAPTEPIDGVTNEVDNVASPESVEVLSESESGVSTEETTEGADTQIPSVEVMPIVDAAADARRGHELLMEQTRRAEATEVRVRELEAQLAEREEVEGLPFGEICRRLAENKLLLEMGESRKEEALQRQVEFEELRAQLQDLQTRFEQLVDKDMAMSLKFEELQVECDRINAENESLKAQLEEANDESAELAELRAQLAEAQKKLATIKAGFEAITSTLQV